MGDDPLKRYALLLGKRHGKPQVLVHEVNREARLKISLNALAGPANLIKIIGTAGSLR